MGTKLSLYAVPNQKGKISSSRAVIWYVQYYNIRIHYILFEVHVLEKKKKEDEQIEIFTYGFLHLPKG